jgi:GNAT superfamily N-acetyltransferase
MTVTVRTAVRSDARAIARVRVETWRAAYDGLIAREVLDHLDVDREGARREELWDEYHADPRGAELIAHADRELAGWAAVGPSIDDDLPDDGQIYAIYSLPEFWGTGVGFALLQASEAFLREAGFTHAHLWYLDGNERAAEFYRRNGWLEDGVTKHDDRLVAGVSTEPLFERRCVKQLQVRPHSRFVSLRSLNDRGQG